MERSAAVLAGRLPWSRVSTGPTSLVRFVDAQGLPALLAAGVVVRDRAMGKPDALRITIGKPEENDRVLTLSLVRIDGVAA
jgi:hypothetical protein